MRIVFALVFLIGIGIAGFATYLGMDHFKKVQADNHRLQARADLVVDTTPVILAATNLRYGQQLKKEHVKEVQFPVKAVPENSFTSMEDLFGDEDTAPRAILRTIEEGELITATKVTKFGQDAGVSSSLSRGMRAFTIKVDVTTGVSGFLQPGDRVDIYWSGRKGGGGINGGGAPVTKLILEGVDLIAIDQSADQDAKRPTVARTVTVEVSPLVVATLAQAQATGRLSLALRGAEEETIIGEILEVKQEDLLGIEEVVVEEEKKCFQNVRRGVEVIKQEVACPTE
ncbi:Flp pilus assembly protein CpaB [Halovulum sp. GXIMD14793]